MSRLCSRFAPSASGSAHPGTLLAGLLCWLDARSQSGRIILRIEDLDRQRCSAQLVQDLQEQIFWFGLDDWDAVEIQSQQQQRHHQALAELAASQDLYRCSCSRRSIQAQGRRAVDGGWVYPGSCRQHIWQGEAYDGVIRLRCREGQQLRLQDANGSDLSQDIAQAMGDPILRRRDGSVAYHLASVVDDLAQGVNHIVRGRDLAPSTATQVFLRHCLGGTTPLYRHHLLLCEERGEKLAKFHQAVGVPELAQYYQPTQLCGLLAWIAGLQAHPTPCRPADLLPDFAWRRVYQQDQVLAWDGQQLIWKASAHARAEGEANV